MNIVIDSAACYKQRLTLAEFAVLLSVKQDADIDSTINNLINRKILLQDDEGYHISEHWCEVMQKLLVPPISYEEHLINLAKQMQELYPAGKMPGTSYYYRCNTREVTLKLKKFFEVHGEYSDEQILDATKRFVASFNGNYKFLPLIKYFITKNKPYIGEDGIGHTSEESPLATFLENKEDTNTVTASDDWLSSIRN